MMIDPDILLMDGFDEAFAGILSRFGQEDIACYDYDKVIEILMEQGMTWEEAVEFHEFNQAGAWVGERTPAFLTRKSPKDLKSLRDEVEEEFSISTRE